MFLPRPPRLAPQRERGTRKGPGRDGVTSEHEQSVDHSLNRASEPDHEAAAASQQQNQASMSLRGIAGLHHPISGRVSVHRVISKSSRGGSARHMMFKGDLALVEKISVPRQRMLYYRATLSPRASVRAVTIKRFMVTSSAFANYIRLDFSRSYGYTFEPTTIFSYCQQDG